ncbi:MAG: chromosome segregation protein SMC [Oligoflexales bacterium]
MHLKKIVISGFKSFADRVTLSFDPTHITGVVGPNGSGKSNVIDAVRWVMGEQNARTLRGESATDIIFAGSQRRKGLGMAEVTLTFDNSQSSPFCPPQYRHEPEVSLTRRIYIDGQREALINKQPCRLKDITEFFTAAGLGGRSYAMIQQGQVDRILQARPEQIREIIEEAAGTSVFKKRREETSKRLLDTQQNLERLDDLLSELERQKKTLASQVDSARQWQEWTDEIRETEHKVFHHQHWFFTNKINDIEKQKIHSADQDIAIRTELSSTEAILAQKQQELSEADPEYHKISEQFAQVREKIASAEAAYLGMNELMSSSDSRTEALKTDLQTEHEQATAAQEQLEEAQTSLDTANVSIIDLMEQLEEFESRMEMVTEETQVYLTRMEEAKEETTSLHRLLDNNQVRRESFEKQLSQAAREKSEREDRLLTLEEEHSQASILHDAAKVRVASCQHQAQKLAEKKHQIESSLSALQQRQTQQQQQKDHFKHQYMEVEARRTSLEEMMSQKGSIQDLLNDLQHVESVAFCPELLNFTEHHQELAPAVKSAFEAWAHRLILFHSQDLDQISAAAQETDAIAASLCSEYEGTVAMPPEGASAMTRYVSCDNRVQFLLERIHIVDQHPQQHPEGLILIDSSGCIRGNHLEFWVGGCKTQNSLLTQKSTLETLIQQSKHWKERLEHTEDILLKISKDQDYQQKNLKDHDTNMQVYHQDLLEASAELHKNAQHMSHKTELMETARKEFDEFDEKCEQLAEQLESLRANAETLEQELAENKEQLQEAQEAYEEAEERCQEMKRQNDQQHLDLATAKAKRESLSSQMNSYQTRAQEALSRSKKRQQELDTLLLEVQEASERRQSIQTEIEEFLKTRDFLEERLGELRSANSELVTLIRSLEQKSRDLRDQISVHQDTHNKLLTEIETTRQALENNRSRALESGEIDPALNETPPNDDDFDFDAQNAMARIRTLKQKVDSLGAVNMIAIEEHKDIVDRESFIVQQKDEVTSAMDLLELAIEEIEETSTRRFLETFENLNREFQQLFPILFPNGEGRLQMEQPDNPLQSGCEIFVRLPGKKAQNMRLFSGGERALTAIALIFALLKSKPTPFCFLDEVDAPLDETNVGRYNRVLEALSDRFQFIVITHRRKTMEVLDTLFGVTMQEGGVSKVVGVDMGTALPSHLQKSFQDRKGATAAPPAPSL